MREKVKADEQKKPAKWYVHPEGYFDSFEAIDS